jgi:hypothetical protein
MAIKASATTAMLLLAGSAHAAAQDRFVSKLTLPTGQTVVVEEGELEARSIGSFSVRLYEAAAAPDETTFFTDGLVRARDGVIDRVMLADVGGDPKPEIIVVMRSVGTGGYLSVQAFSVAADKLILYAAVEGLSVDADPAAALRKNRTRQE